MTDYPSVPYSSVAVDRSGGIYYGHLQQWIRVGTTPSKPAMIWSRSSDGGILIALQNGDLYRLGSGWTLTLDSNVFATHDTLLAMADYPSVQYSAVAVDRSGGIYHGHLQQWSRVGTTLSKPATIWSRGSDGSVFIPLQNGDLYRLASDWTLTLDSKVFATQDTLLAMADYPNVQYSAVAVDRSGGIYHGHLQQWSRVGTTLSKPATIWSRGSDGSVFIALQNGDLYRLGSDWTLTFDSNVFAATTPH